MAYTVRLYKNNGNLARIYTNVHTVHFTRNESLVLTGRFGPNYNQCEIWWRKLGFHHVTITEEKSDDLSDDSPYVVKTELV